MSDSAPVFKPKVKWKPYFTMRKKEWNALGPKGQAAMRELAAAIAKAHQEGKLEQQKEN